MNLRAVSDNQDTLIKLSHLKLENLVDIWPLASGRVMTRQSKDMMSAFRVWEICDGENNQDCIHEIVVNEKKLQGERRRDIFSYYLPEGPLLAKFNDRIANMSREVEFLYRLFNKNKFYSENYYTKDLSNLTANPTSANLLVTCKSFVIDENRIGLVKINHEEKQIELHITNFVFDNKCFVDIFASMNDIVFSKSYEKGMSLADLEILSLANDKLVLINKCHGIIEIFSLVKQVDNLEIKLLSTFKVNKNFTIHKAFTYQKDEVIFITFKQDQSIFIKYNFATKQHTTLQTEYTFNVDETSLTIPNGNFPFLILPFMKKTSPQFALFNVKEFSLHQLDDTGVYNFHLMPNGRMVCKMLDGLCIVDLKSRIDYAKNLVRPSFIDFNFPEVIEEIVYGYWNQDRYPLTNYGSFISGNNLGDQTNQLKCITEEKSYGCSIM